MKLEEMLDNEFTVKQALEAVDKEDRAARRFVINAAAVGISYGEPLNATPLYCGYTARHVDRIQIERAIQRGQRLAERFGWP